MKTFMNKKSIVGTLSALLLLGSSDVRGAPQTWNGTTDTKWETIANWTSAVPTGTDVATIPTKLTVGNAPATISSTTPTGACLELDFTAGSGAIANYVLITGSGASAQTLSIGANGVHVTTATTGRFDLTNGTVGFPTNLSIASGGAAANGPDATAVVNYNLLSGYNTLSFNGIGQTGGALANVTMTGGTGNQLTTGSTAMTLNDIASNASSDKIVLGNTLTFGSANSTSIAGVISESGAGTGAVVKQGAGKLTLTNVNTYTNGTTVNAGELKVQGSIKGNLTVNNGSILSGAGTVCESSPASTALIANGTVKPGNSIGILHCGGIYNHQIGFYEVEIQGQGNVAGVNNDAISIAGTSTIGGDSVVVEVVSLDGSYFIGGRYDILTSVGLRTGEFNPIVVANTAIDPVLVYDDNNVYLDYRPTFLSCATNQNGRNVAEQLFLITNPDADETLFLNAITSLNCEDIGIALDLLSGSQYSELLLSTELSTHQFVRRLYDPLRTFLAKDLTCCDPCCDPCACCNNGFEVWVEGGGTHSRFKSSHEGHGFKNKGWQVTAGAQMASCDNTWVGGAAITYEHTNADFNFGGTANTKTILGGLYGAYRMCDFYLLGDIVFGGSQSKLKRDFFISTDEFFERGKPEALQGIIYAEFGKDFRYCSFLIQPFLGLEGGYYSYKRFSEDGDEPVDLHFNKRSYGTFDTRLGVHLVADEIVCGLFVGIDLAWQYRCTENNNYLEASFFDSVSPFGGNFRVHGSKLDPNSFEAALNIEQKIGENWSVFASGYWQQWSKANAYDLLAGVSMSW